MDRLHFFKQTIGTAIATAIGSKLDFIPVPEPETLVPGLGSQAFKIHLSKHWCHPGDIIMVGKDQEQYYVSLEDCKLIARAIYNPDAASFEIVDYSPTEDEIKKLCSVATL